MALSTSRANRAAKAPDSRQPLDVLQVLRHVNGDGFIWKASPIDSVPAPIRPVLEMLLDSSRSMEVSKTPWAIGRLNIRPFQG